MEGPRLPETALAKAVRFGALVDGPGDSPLLAKVPMPWRSLRESRTRAQRRPISYLSRMAEEYIQTEGKIVAVLAGTMFRVELANQHVVLAHISGKMRKRFIRLTNGDRVKLEMSPYDLDKARITYRLG